MDASALSLTERPALGGRSNDWLFVTAAETKGWILDAICREIGARTQGTWDVAYGPKIIPKAGAYFFSHYLLWLDNLKRNPHLEGARSLVWMTHPRSSRYSDAELVAGLGKAKHVVFACSSFRDFMLARGLSAAQSSVVLGAADPAMFLPHQRTGGGAVGFSSAYYERKGPDIILDLVRMAPHRRFILVGRGWEAYPRFPELSAAPNFQYLTASFREYPAIYAQMDVFVSPALLEGGPIPLMETMMCNVVPVASCTGFAPDIIRRGENGFLFEIGAPASDILPLIEQAFLLGADVRATVQAYSWDAFARRIIALAEG